MTTLKRCGCNRNYLYEIRCAIPAPLPPLTRPNMIRSPYTLELTACLSLLCRMLSPPCPPHTNPPATKKRKWKFQSTNNNQRKRAKERGKRLQWASCRCKNPGDTKSEGKKIDPKHFVGVTYVLSSVAKSVVMSPTRHPRCCRTIFMFNEVSRHGSTYTSESSLLPTRIRLFRSSPVHSLIFPFIRSVCTHNEMRKSCGAKIFVPMLCVAATLLFVLTIYGILIFRAIYLQTVWHWERRIEQQKK